ncbi:hypothetical protein DFJ73DRAFT_769735 [Zopfochytrium polystomum]|nr:hypothetical protein DFJ73DRAFT_769735 [Zopfochytrium polystomum]
MACICQSTGLIVPRTSSSSLLWDLGIEYGSKIAGLGQRRAFRKYGGWAWRIAASRSVPEESGLGGASAGEGEWAGVGVRVVVTRRPVGGLEGGWLRGGWFSVFDVGRVGALCGPADEEEGGNPLIQARKRRGRWQILMLLLFDVFNVWRSKTLEGVVEADFRAQGRPRALKADALDPVNGRVSLTAVVVVWLAAWTLKGIACYMENLASLDGGDRLSAEVDCLLLDADRSKWVAGSRSKASNVDGAKKSEMSKGDSEREEAENKTRIRVLSDGKKIV